jgi:hypothetical protein
MWVIKRFNGEALNAFNFESYDKADLFLRSFMLLNCISLEHRKNFLIVPID